LDLIIINFYYDLTVCPTPLCRSVPVSPRANFINLRTIKSMQTSE